MKKYRLLTQKGYHELRKHDIYDENHRGWFSGYTVGEFAKLRPEEWEEVKEDKKRYRCLTSLYNSFEKNKVYDENHFGITNFVKELVGWHPNDWELVEDEDESEFPCEMLVWDDDESDDIPRLVIEKTELGYYITKNEGGVVTAWKNAKPLPKKELPVIGGHTGKLREGVLTYGCFDINLDSLKKLFNDLKRFSFIESIKVRRVDVTLKQIVQILDYYEENKV